jgi:hypothetical protein
LKGKVIPVKTRTTGSIPKSFRIYLSNTPGIQEIKELLTTAVFGTVHTQTFNVKNNMTCAVNFNYRITKTLYTLDIYFVSGI